jgi:tRNA1(Val) A37 N6-methylase TrmN6
VGYIVKNALGMLLRDKSGKEENIRVLDPACGSGSFLIKVFDVLDEYYRQSDKDYNQTRLDLNAGVIFTRKVRTLQDHIFGVDLDKKAVEIAQLNLLLKIAEKGHRLPLLEQNIKNGNSLIEDERLAGDLAFDWKEKFRQVIDEGGFDVVVGNPPYFNIKSDSELRELKDYKLLSNGVVNASALFVKRSIDLLKPNGYLGFIIPKSFAYVDSWKPLRDFIYDNAQLIKIVDVSKAFEGVLLEQVIIVVKKQKAKESELVEVVSDFTSPNQHIDQVEYGRIISSNTIAFSSNIGEKNLLDKMNQNSVMLGEISENFRGIGAQQCVSESVSGSERILSGKEIQRYAVSNYHNYFITKENVSMFKKADKLRQPKIMCQNIVAHIRNHIKVTATYDESGILNLDTVNNILMTTSRFLPKHVLGLLNSKLISYYTYNFIYSKAIRTMHFDGNYSGKIPIKNISIESQRTFEGIVNHLISLSCKLVEIGVRETDETQRIRNEIGRLEKELDGKIYELYGLDEGEIEIVEKSFI